MATEHADAVLRRHAARNFWVNVGDGVSYIFGISMISRLTVMPLFVEKLGGNALVQGLLPTIYYIGWLMPSLFMAPVVASMARRKPYILFATIFERVVFLILGILLLSAPDLPHPTILVLFFILFTVYAFGSGFTSTAWQDFVARIIPKRRWGIFFGMQNGVGGIFGVASAWVATTLLRDMPFPQSVGVLALLCFVGQAISYGCLALSVEPPQDAQPRTPWREFMGGIMPLLRRDAAFRRYLFCRAAIALGFVGHNFLTAALLARFQVADAEIGVITGVLIGAQAVAHVLMGALADRWGHKQVLVLSTLLGMVTLVLAVVAPDASWYYLIFALMGAAQAGYTLSGFTLIFSFSTPALRPTYIGVANTALAPAAALGPLLAGAVAAVAGYELLFGVLTVIGVAGMLALQLWVRVPHVAELND
ncbi:MFS transporter [Chloroflexia bacterium SDU3-3]|nr:MFS transporter [Chloroflexia bacterium SDU3-3]